MEIDKNAWIAEPSRVFGKIRMKEFSSIWFNCTVRGDNNLIEIGSYSNVQDNVVIHASLENPCFVGNYVTIDSSAILHACTIGNGCFIGVGAKVMDAAVIGSGSIVEAGALVSKGTVVPENSLVAGIPAKVIGKSTNAQRKRIQDKAFAHSRLWQEKYRDINIKV